MLNLFEVPVALLTPLFRLSFHSFDPNKKTIAKERKKKKLHAYVMLLQWVCYSVTHKKGPMSLSIKHLFVRLVWRVKQSWFTVMFLKGWTQIWDLFPPLICQSLTPHSHQNPWGFTLDAVCLALYCSVLPSLVTCLSRSIHHLIFPSSPIAPPSLCI